VRGASGSETCSLLWRTAGGRSILLRLDLNLPMLHTSDIRPGDHARLHEVGGERSFRRRLMELGFLPGTTVRLVRRISVGDLVEFEVRGGHISLRASEATALIFENDR